MAQNHLQTSKTRLPRVSIIINVHNGEGYIRPAIQSILNQSFDDFELIVVNDGSTDSTADLVRNYLDPRIRLVENQTSIGIPKAINRGIGFARGEYIAHQDADDISYPLRLVRQVEFMDAHPDVAGIGTRFVIINKRGQTIHYWPGDMALPVTQLGIRWAMLFARGFLHSSFMFRRKVAWDELNGYDEDCPRVQDYEFWSRLAMRHNILNLPEALVGFRRHAGSNTRVNPIPVDTFERLIRRTMQQTLESVIVPSDDWIHNYSALVLSPVVPGRREAGELITGLRAIYTRFGQIHPEAIHLGEIKREYAFQLTTLASYLARKNCKRESIRVFTEAYRTDWRIAALVLPKYFAFLSMGDFAQRIWYESTLT